MGCEIGVLPVYLVLKGLGRPNGHLTHLNNSLLGSVPTLYILGALPSYRSLMDGTTGFFETHGLFACSDLLVCTWNSYEHNMYVSFSLPDFPIRLTI